MNVSLNWLRDYVDWTGTPAELDHLLTRTGLAVENITTREFNIPNVVVAQILESSQHPNADRLSVCQVADGSAHPRQIVCGAKNYKVGDKVPLALPGAVLPGDFKIKVGKLRGVESEGMMCSGKELGLSADSDGLLILPPDTKVGTPIGDLFPSDTVVELEITPNRADWLSHVGVAREISAFTGAPLRWQAPAAVPTRAAGEEVTLSSATCPFYGLRRIRGVKVGPSPKWLRERLESVGLRSINNIVDVTNYVMLELGEPLHAFDAAQIEGGINVRAASEGEKFLALDGREYTLPVSSLVIADSKKALAIAGVMGGEHSGVSAQTIDLVLESALFDGGSIRRTARALNLHSDSSYRFERGIDSAMVLAASARATQLIVELAGGTPDPEVLVAGELPAAPAPIKLRSARCRALLGVDVSDADLEKALTGLGLHLSTKDADSSTWEISSHRRDLTREVDLIEEVGRVVDIQNIPAKVTAIPMAPTAADALYDFQMLLREKLGFFGLSEARTSTLVSEAMRWQDEAPLKLRNPLGEDQSYLRTSMVPGLLTAVERNIRNGRKTIGLYEIGRTYRGGEMEESDTVAFVLYGAAASNGWRGGAERSLDWYDAKGVVESLLPTGADFAAKPALAPLALAAHVSVEDQAVGLLGQLSPSAARGLDASTSVLVAELSVAALMKLAKAPVYQSIPTFPAVSRDVAIICPIALAYDEIKKVLLGAGEELLTEISPFDVFTDPSGIKLPADRKSLAISLTFRASGRTLTGEEVSAACERLKQQLRAKLAVDFRE